MSTDLSLGALFTGLALSASTARSSAEEALDVSAWSAAWLALFVVVLLLLLVAIARLVSLHHLLLSIDRLSAGLSYRTTGLAVEAPSSHVRPSSAATKATSWRGDHRSALCHRPVGHSAFSGRTTRAEASAESTTGSASVESASLRSKGRPLDVGATRAGHIGRFIALQQLFQMR